MKINEKLSCQTRHSSLFLCGARKGAKQTVNPTQNAQIAQLVEQLAFNQLVQGSSPCLRTFY
jgi:hypothetical protein